MINKIKTDCLFEQVLNAAQSVILAFSPDGRVAVLNRAAAQLLGEPQEAIEGRAAHEVGLEQLIQGPPMETISLPLIATDRRWIACRTYFEQSGIRYLVVVLAEVSEALRTQEREAWRKIIRVLGHEINNSLAPIMSMSRTLARMCSEAQLPEALEANVKEGLEIIGDRAEALNRFLQNYARLSSVPPPTRRLVELKQVVQHVCSLEHRIPVQIVPGPEVDVFVDSDQLEQVLINIVRNGVESVLASGDGALPPDSVSVTWTIKGADLKIWIRDHGLGLSDHDSIFVPFYRTKPTGSGLGLLLSRQILEAHGGSVALSDRRDTRGCEVQVTIPNCVQPSAVSN